MSLCEVRLGTRRSTELLSRSRPGLFSRGLLGWNLSKFNGAARTIAHWLLAVCNVVWHSLSRMMPQGYRTLCSICVVRPRDRLTHRLWQTIKHSNHGRYLEQRYAPYISCRTTKCCFRCASLARDKQNDLCKTICRRCASCWRLLVWVRYRKIKVPTFLNLLRHGPARQTLFRKMPSTMEEAIEIS